MAMAESSERRRPRYNDGSKAEAVIAMRRRRPFADVAAELGAREQALRRWSTGAKLTPTRA